MTTLTTTEALLITALKELLNTIAMETNYNYRDHKAKEFSRHLDTLVTALIAPRADILTRYMVQSLFQEQFDAQMANKIRDVEEFHLLAIPQMLMYLHHKISKAQSQTPDSERHAHDKDVAHGRREGLNAALDIIVEQIKISPSDHITNLKAAIKAEQEKKASNEPN